MLLAVKCKICVLNLHTAALARAKAMPVSRSSVSRVGAQPQTRHQQRRRWRQPAFIAKVDTESVQGPVLIEFRPAQCSFDHLGSGDLAYGICSGRVWLRISVSKSWVFLEWVMSSIQSTLPEQVLVREVGLRDGLPSLACVLATEHKLAQVAA